MEDRRKQEPIGLNSKEKEVIRQAIKIVNSNATKGAKKTTLSGFMRESAVERAYCIINLNK